jgi:hypothetical protein
MSESEWDAADDPLALLARVFPVRGHDSGEPPPRKLRLYYAACARREWARLPWVCRELVAFAEEATDGAHSDPWLRHAVYDLAERLLGSCREDEAGAQEELNDARDLLARLLGRGPGNESGMPPQPWDGFARLLYAPFAQEAAWFYQIPSGFHRPELVRDVFRYPPAVTQSDPTWLTSPVLGMARPMYTRRDFSHMPVLADALQDAGCEDEAVLAHCRGPGPHARGCWVLDLVLGKR